MHQIPFEQAPESVQRLVTEAMAGEEVVFLRGRRPVVKLVPIEPAEPKNETWRLEMQALRGILKGIDTTIPREKDREL